jgi:hypothetical protein
MKSYKRFIIKNGQALKKKKKKKKCKNCECILMKDIRFKFHPFSLMHIYIERC